MKSKNAVISLAVAAKDFKRLGKEAGIERMTIPAYIRHVMRLKPLKMGGARGGGRPRKEG